MWLVKSFWPGNTMNSIFLLRQREVHRDPGILFWRTSQSKDQDIRGIGWSDGGVLSCSTNLSTAVDTSNSGCLSVYISNGYIQEFH